MLLLTFRAGNMVYIDIPTSRSLTRNNLFGCISEINSLALRSISVGHTIVLSRYRSLAFVNSYLDGYLLFSVRTRSVDMERETLGVWRTRLLMWHLSGSILRHAFIKSAGILARPRPTREDSSPCLSSVSFLHSFYDSEIST